MCIATANALEPLTVKAPTQQEWAPMPAPESGIKWRKGDYGPLQIEPEVVRVKTLSDLRIAARKHGVDDMKDRLGLSVIHRNKEGKWSARIYVVSGRDEKATLEHEMHHVRGYIHD